MPLTPQQRLFAEHDNAVFLQACPGAGKTRAIVARVSQQLTTGLRKGIATISFTNAAVDEFRRRCTRSGISTVLNYPHFIGTFDAFVRDFVVYPYWSAVHLARPTIVDSWDTLGVELRLTGPRAFRGDGLSLDAFRADSNLLVAERVRPTALRQHAELHRDTFQEMAARTRARLIAAHYLGSDDAKESALQAIRHPLFANVLAEALRGRFREVIVDEGQDSSPSEIELLRWMLDCGIRVSFVCDPDQAIFQFRDGSAESLRNFRATFGQENQLLLTGNFRSSKTICKLASTLKRDGTQDDALGENANARHANILITYPGGRPTDEIGTAFCESVDAVGINRGNSIILAHARSVARSAAGLRGAHSSGGASRIASMAKAVRELKSLSSTARSKEHALQSVEAALLELMGLREEKEHIHRAIARSELDPRELRRRALHVVSRLPDNCGSTDADRISWIESLRAAVTDLALPLPQGVTVRNYFRAPQTADWADLLKPETQAKVGCATIHEAKGCEFDAVCVVVPPNRAPENFTMSLVDEWDQRADSEHVRVLFVGVTRAKKLCALAVPLAVAPRIVRILERAEVNYRRQDL